MALALTSSWPTTLELSQAAFPLVECLREISDFQQSFRMGHRFSGKRHTMSVVTSRFTSQVLPANDSLDFHLPPVT